MQIINHTTGLDVTKYAIQFLEGKITLEEYKLKIKVQN